MLYLKSCPRLRCFGDIEANSDRYGMFFKCLQCGYSRDISPQMAKELFGEGEKGTDAHKKTLAKH